ncbi:MAG: class I SAM-dependent methyltransferase [Candidatus Rifleibacteriota bacterium]
MKQPDYQNYAGFYDYFELAGFDESEELNIFLNEIFQLNSINSIVDFACGTGAQSIGLAKRGYKITAVDNSQAMIDQAKKKADKLTNLSLNFVVADMVNARLGKFDAAICIFNAIGHLTRKQFSEFLKNAYNQILEDGLLIFDIFNFTAMSEGKIEEYEQMNKELQIDGCLINHVRICRLLPDDKKLIINSITRKQDGINEPESIEDEWEMQLYEADELKELILQTGFKEIEFFGATGTEFDRLNSDSIFAICQK